MSEDQELCQFCDKAKFRYTCPKCNARYCSVDCYKSQEHLKCSEEFYKSWIRDDLSSAEPNSREDIRKIYNILKRIKDSDAGFNPEDFDADGLGDPLDSDDDVPVDEDCAEEDIASRLQGIDINNADDVWTRLTSEEQQEFQNLIETGDIMKLLPDYKPWWHTRQNSKIVVLPKESECDKSSLNIPAISTNIHKFADICKRTPSPCLHYNLWNILTAYGCVVRFFGGEHQTNSSEAVAHLVNLCSTFKYGTNFEDAEDAILSVEMEALTTKGKVGSIATVGTSVLVESRDQLQQDARQLMSRKDYKLAALSDILQLLMVAKQQMKNKKCEQADFQKLFALCTGSVELNRTKLQQLVKKVEFMLSYVNRDSVETI